MASDLGAPLSTPESVATFVTCHRHLRGGGAHCYDVSHYVISSTSVEMTSELSKILDLLSVNDISTISTEDRGEHVRIHRIDNKTTRIIPSPSIVWHSWRKISPSPICRLPPELLSSIFLQYTRQWHCECRSTSTAEIPRWVDVSYVCRYWRNVSLNCSSLWTRLFFVSPRWMDELLL